MQSQRLNSDHKWLMERGWVRVEDVHFGSRTQARWAHPVLFPGGETMNTERAQVATMRRRSSVDYLLEDGGESAARNVLHKVTVWLGRTSTTDAGDWLAYTLLTAPREAGKILDGLDRYTYVLSLMAKGRQ